MQHQIRLAEDLAKQLRQRRGDFTKLREDQNLLLAPSETTPSRRFATMDSVPEGIPARFGRTIALPFAPMYLSPPTTPSIRRDPGTPNLASGVPTEPLPSNRPQLAGKRAGTLPVRLSRVYGIAVLGTPGQNRVRRKNPQANLPVIQPSIKSRIAAG
jgi:hypothetical protein